MRFDFDTPVPLKDTHSQKFDAMARFTGCTAEDGLPMWVADMDFRPPPAVLEAMQAEVTRGVFGYYGEDGSLRRAICDWMTDMHGWALDPDWLSFSHGVVHGLGLTLSALTEPGDGVVIFTPVYHAFAKKIEAVGRRVVESPLRTVDGRYEMDLDALEASLTGHERMVVFCSPHNPGGRLWSADEIAALDRFCARHGLWLVSDEIHMDLTFPGARHLPTAVAAPDSLPRLVMLSSASKGFNVAGAETSFIATPDETARGRIAAATAAHGGSPNRFGMVIMEACFAHGAEWSAAVRDYIAGNFRLFRDGVAAIPGLEVMDMDSTYLAWVDFENTGMARDEFTRRVVEDARIAVNRGPTFGTGGENFLRFNVATQRASVAEAVDRLAKAFGDLQ